MDYPISARYSPDWERYPLPKLLKSGPKEVPAKDLHPDDFCLNLPRTQICINSSKKVCKCKDQRIRKWRAVLTLLMHPKTFKPRIQDLGSLQNSIVRMKAQSRHDCRTCCPDPLLVRLPNRLKHLKQQLVTNALINFIINPPSETTIQEFRWSKRIEG
jgi:hypothetical protein